MHHRMPAGPDRRRNNSTSKRGAPGACASNAAEAAADTAQRVSAALGTGSASLRSSSAVTPLARAASASRRLAVRSSARILPGHSITTALSAAQRTASVAARSSATSSGMRPKINRAGSSPSSASPGA